MNRHLATRTTAVGLRRHLLIVTLMFVTLWSASSAFGQAMQFYPIRSAPLGSPAGTVGDPVTPQFNAALGCWELEVNPGVEVDIDVQVFGWGNAPGSPLLASVYATSAPIAFSSGAGPDVVPKGWPDNPEIGFYLGQYVCIEGGNGDPCTSPFGDFTCDKSNGVCGPNPDFVMPECAKALSASVAHSDGYVWGSAVQVDCNVDDGEVKTLGGMILNVPLDAQGTYLIDFNTDPNNSFMFTWAVQEIEVIEFTSACITVIDNGEPGRCCSNIGPNVVCEVVTPLVCSTRPEPRLFAAGETCGGDSACPTCLSDADCDDGHACTADTCDETGQCGHTISCPEMRFYPIRMAPLGSPAGTVGYSVTPEFNSDLDCWELEVMPGYEVDIDLQAFGWGSAPGSPLVGAIQGTVVSAGYDNGVGGVLNPKGWPESPFDGAYQARRSCEGGGGNGLPCVFPFDPTCGQQGGGTCVVHSPRWMFQCEPGLDAIAFPTLDYAWAVAVGSCGDIDDGTIRTFGGLILEVPFNATGTYVIAFDSDPNNSFMSNFTGAPVPGVAFTSACITVVPPAAKNRYLTFAPSEPGPVAYKLDMVSSLFHPDAVVSGWIGAPDAKGIASLEPDPVTRDWTEAVVDVTGCEITPVAEFELRASVDSGATFLPPVTLKTADQPIGNKWWGDLAGDFNGTIWTAPQGVTNFNDVIAIQVSFQGLLNAPGLPRVDVAPQEPNRIANVDDVLFVIFAFKGEPYPFGCPGDPCHDKLISPCP